MSEVLCYNPEETKLKGIEASKTGGWQEMPKESPFKTEKVVSETPEVTPDMISNLEKELSKSGLGKVKVMKGSEAIKNVRDRKTKRALGESGSIIVDTGSIENLTEARTQEEQEFSSKEIAVALVRDGIISVEDVVLKLGTSGAVLEGGAGAEIIEGQIIKDGKIGIVTKAATKGESGVEAGRIDSDKRVLLENEFIVKRQNPEEGKAIYISIAVEGDGEKNVDLVSLIDQMAQSIRLENYTVRATIIGPLKADVAVIKDLPEEKIKNAQDIGKLLVVGSQKSGNENNKFHFVGTRTPARTRQSDRWKKITGQGVYPGDKAGHYHGYSEDGRMGGHLRNLKPQLGSKLEIILEPAEVVKVFDPNREALK